MKIHFNKTLRRVLIAVVFLILLSFPVIGNPQIYLHNRSLNHALNAVTQDSITLEEVVPFAWDKLYTFDPYVSREEKEAILGLHSRAVDETASEGMVDLIFLHDGKIVCSICGFPQNLGYTLSFTDTASDGPYAMISYGDEISFTVTQTEDDLLHFTKQ